MKHVDMAMTELRNRLANIDKHLAEVDKLRKEREQIVAALDTLEGLSPRTLAVVNAGGRERETADYVAKGATSPALLATAAGCSVSTAQQRLMKAYTSGLIRRVKHGTYEAACPPNPTEQDTSEPEPDGPGTFVPRADPDAIYKACLKVLRDRPDRTAAVKDVADALGLWTAAVGVILTSAVRRGEVEKLRSGYYKAKAVTS